MKVAGNETGETMRNVTNNKKIVSSSKQQQQQQPFGWLAVYNNIPTDHLGSPGVETQVRPGERKKRDSR
jgi:hypothetical protein